MSFKECDLGFELKHSNQIQVFGNRFCDMNALKEQYPELQFIRLKQTHSNAVINVDKSTVDFKIEGDALITKDKNLALAISTADCLPILIQTDKEYIAAIHAGWRGVANRIIPKTIDELVKLGVEPFEMVFSIGPHIQKQSFVVKKDVLDLILNSIKIEHQNKDQFIQDCFQELSENQYIVDLNSVVALQLQEYEIDLEQVILLNIDTVEDLEFHSYRRDKDKSGRQLSFIAKI